MKVNTAVKITYQAAGATTELTDVVSKILDETESLDPTNFPDVTLTESTDIPGEYLGEFTPDVVGTWRSVTDSATQPGKVVKQYDVIANDADSVNDAVAGLNNITASDVTGGTTVSSAEGNIRGGSETLETIKTAVAALVTIAPAQVG